MANGKIQPDSQTRLRKMGRWLAGYGESIYETRGGPTTPRPWHVTTQEGNKIYILSLGCQDASLALPRLAGNVNSAHFWKGGSRGDASEGAGGLILQIPPKARDDFEAIAVLELVQQ